MRFAMEPLEYLKPDNFQCWPRGGGNLSFQDTGLCHSNRKSTTHKSGKLSQKYTHKSGEISQKYTYKSGEFLKIIPMNPGMPKKLINN